MEKQTIKERIRGFKEILMENDTGSTTFENKDADALFEVLEEVEKLLEVAEKIVNKKV